MRRSLWLPAFVIAACSGSQVRPQSEVVYCKLRAIDGIPVPSDAVYQALAGSPEALTPYLLQRLTPELVVDTLARWRACAPGGSAE